MHTKKEKTRLFIITFTIIMLLVVLVGSVYKDWQQILANRKTENELNSQYNALLDEEAKLNAEIIKLGDDEGIVRYAKETYLLTAPGDTIIKSEKQE